MKISSRVMTALGTVLATGTALAHEGHGTVGSLEHELAHAGWLAGAIMFAAVLAALILKWTARVDDKSPAERTSTARRRRD